VEDDLFNGRTFWMHGLRCGLFAQAVATRVPSVKPEIAFTLGVLHDIGRVIILQTIPDSYRDVMIAMREQRKYLWQVEREVLGFHHGEIGGRASGRWHLPSAYCEAIEFHHEPARAAEESRLAHTLALADSLSYYAGASGVLERAVQPVYRGLWEPLGLAEAVVRDIVQQSAAIDVKTRSFYEQALN
jgi:HD-like signal output (HDOD) protein